MERHGEGFGSPFTYVIYKYDNMHYVKYAINQETRISHRPSTPQRFKVDR